MTAARINRSVALGDPGILASLIVDPPTVKDSAVGLVLHHVDWAAFRRDAVPASWTLINPNAPVDEVIKSIASCELIVSSSLHGLITADAFQIPGIWAQTQAALYGGTDFKFHDYATARGSAFNEPVPYSAIIGKTPDEISDLGTTSARSIEDWQKELIAAFPSDL